MKWNKLGIIWNSSSLNTNELSHAMLPTPISVDNDIIRIYYTALDKSGRGRPFFIDVSSANPNIILNYSTKPLLEIGSAGRFDDSGVVCTSVIKLSSGTWLMYYAGFEKLLSVRYRIFTGVAESKDQGLTFQKISENPMLDRRDGESLFRAGPFVLEQDGGFKMWYISGDSWQNFEGKELPIYDMKVLTSSDPINWPSHPETSMKINPDLDEHGFGRPWVIKDDNNMFKLFYSIRVKSKGKYSMGYAESTDGNTWVRKDNIIGLNEAVFDFEKESVCYASVIKGKEKTYCFYNGNNFGESGIAMAVLEP